MAVSIIKGNTVQHTTVGSLDVYRNGRVVTLIGQVTASYADRWVVVANGLPQPPMAMAFVAQDASGAADVSMNLTTSGELQFYGRGAKSEAKIAFTYLTTIN